MLRYLSLFVALLTLGLIATTDSALDWPADRALPSFPDVADKILWADLSSLTSDEQLLLTSLQGIVNRQQPRIYLYWNDNDESNRLWLEGIAEHVQVENVTDRPFHILDRYRSQVKGAMVYDLVMIDTVNLATTLAGLHDSVVASRDLALKYNLPIVDDLRGRFNGKLDLYEYALQEVLPRTTNRIITGLSPEELRDVENITWTNITLVNTSVTDRSNSGTYTMDLTPFLGNISSGGSLYLRIKDAFGDDPQRSTIDDSQESSVCISHVRVIADGMLMANFVPGTTAEDPHLLDTRAALRGYPFGERCVRGSNAQMIYQFSFPEDINIHNLTAYLDLTNSFDVSTTTTLPITRHVRATFRDYVVATSALVVWLDPNRPEEIELLSRILSSLVSNAAYLGWFPSGGEMSGVTQAAIHSVYVVAADNLYNGSLMSGLRKIFAVSGQPASTTKTTGIENKIYMSLTWGEGDNIQYNQHRMRQLWDDPARGEFPMGWTISPLLLDIAPNMMHYYQSTATMNDTLVTGPSGAGYTYPSNWPAEDLKSFLDATARYTEATGTASNMWIYDRINTTSIVPIAKQIVEAYKSTNPYLLGLSTAPIQPSFDGISREGAAIPFAVNVTAGLPVAGLLNIENLDTDLQMFKNVSSQYFDGTKPLFVSGLLASWFTNVTEVAVLVKQLPEEFEIVAPSGLWEMAKICAGRDARNHERA